MDTSNLGARIQLVLIRGLMYWLLVCMSHQEIKSHWLGTYIRDGVSIKAVDQIF
jgi:hypothetical protein